MNTYSPTRTGVRKSAAVVIGAIVAIALFLVAPAQPASAAGAGGGGLRMLVQ